MSALERTATEPLYVLNMAAGSLHRCLPNGREDPPVVWRACCGWKYGVGTFSRLHEVPLSHRWDRIGEKCLPTLRAQRREDSFWCEDTLEETADVHAIA